MLEGGFRSGYLEVKRKVGRVKALVKEDGNLVERTIKRERIGFKKLVDQRCRMGSRI